MSFPALYLLFPVVLAIHNLDEYFASRHRTQQSRPSWLMRYYQSEVARLAMMLLTVASVVVAVLNYVERDGKLNTVAELSVFALLFNAIGHVIVSLKARSFTPGTRSALIFVLPYSVLAIAAIRRGSGFSVTALWPVAIAGLVALPVAILVALAVARGLQSIARR
jgi:L-asparagine transporter-like permease